MSNRVEIIFAGENALSERKLHCQVDENNRVSWQELPVGEQGISKPFRTSEQAGSFLIGNARILGYSREADKQ